MSEWERIRLNQVLDVAHGYAFPGEQMTECVDGGPIIVSIGNFDYRGGFRFNSTRVREFAGRYPAQFELLPYDLLVVMTCQTADGEILGLPALVPDDGRVYLHNQRIGLVVLNEAKIDRSFAYYVFLSPRVKQQLVVTATGTKVLHTAPGRIGAVEIDLPSLREQRAIGEMLVVLDDKIAVNERIATSAEQLAEAAYKKAVSTTCGSCRLGELLELKYGKSLPAASRNAGPFPVYGSGGISGWHDRPLVGGPGVVVGRKGSVGTVFWSQVDFFPIDTTFHVEMCRLDVGLQFAYFALKNLNLASMNSDSAIPGLNRENALALMVSVPSASELEKFRATASPLFDLKHEVLEESKSLARLRDALLPKLMSGEIRVRDAEKIVEEAV